VKVHDSSSSSSSSSVQTCSNIQRLRRRLKIRAQAIRLVGLFGRDGLLESEGPSDGDDGDDDR